MTPYPLRLIEVDLPIARISAHARREKSIRHGHISTLHIWWARRPLAACRAVILASLWPDPVDLAQWATHANGKGEVRAPRSTSDNDTLKLGEGVIIRPARFLDEARQRMAKWAQIAYAKVSPESGVLLSKVQHKPALLNDPAVLRTALLDFIADFADWDHSTDKDYLDTARALVLAAHEALGGEPGTRPMVIDPFAGGGSIPLEALRVGADAFASDLNPIPVLLNKVVLEYIPKYGQRLADEVRRWGQWIKIEAERELAAFYPKDSDGATPIAYLWARTVLSEAPGQGDIPVEVPLMRSLWLAKKANRRRALRWVRHTDGPHKGKVKTQTVEVTYVEDGQPIVKRVKRPLLEIFEPAKESEVEGGTVARGSATCPVTGFTTKVDRVRAQLKSRRGGAADARLFCVVSTRESEQGRFYRLPTAADQAAFDAAAAELERRERADGTQRSQKGRKDGEGIAAVQGSRRSLVPDEVISLNELRRVSVPIYGMERWGDLFSPRQALALTTLARLVREAGEHMRAGHSADSALAGAASAREHAAGALEREPRSLERAARAKEQEVGSTEPAVRTMERTARTPAHTAGAVAPMPRGGANADQGAPPQRAGAAQPVLGSPNNGDEAADGSTEGEAGFAEALTTCLAMAIDRQADYGSSMCRWVAAGEFIGNTFGRQAIGMIWDFCEVPITSVSTGGLAGALEWVANAIDANVPLLGNAGHVEQASATKHPLPDDAAAAFVTDPPYYDAVPYAYLSDFFYVWMRRTLADVHPTLFRDGGVPKDAEIVVDRPHQLSQSTKDITFYESELTKAFAEGRRVLAPSGVGTIVFASKTTSSWEAILQAVIDAQFIITGSWPIDTEMETRVAAQGQARLGSSVHIVVRPRETVDGSVANVDVGEWREVLAELPRKMEEWMPRLAAEGVVGADAIFACLGPALEIFSRYSRVEKASGDKVALKEYLEAVWAAVSTEALSLIMKDADTAGLEPDARLTAVWLWTVGGGKSASSDASSTDAGEDAEDAGDDSDDEGPSGKKPKLRGFALEFDAARLIAQGLGIVLEKSESVVEVKGETARLLAVAERTKYLFGNEATGPEASSSAVKGKRKKAEATLFQGEEEIKAEIMQAEAENAGKLAAGKAGATVLDRVHQSMLLFAAGRGEALKRFLVEDGIGKDGRFWKLAQSLSALYPAGTDEKRWVDGVLARKKGLGL